MTFAQLLYNTNTAAFLYGEGRYLHIDGLTSLSTDHPWSLLKLHAHIQLHIFLQTSVCIGRVQSAQGGSESGEIIYSKHLPV